jgi:hypothetical protein
MNDLQQIWESLNNCWSVQQEADRLVGHDNQLPRKFRAWPKRNKTIQAPMSESITADVKRRSGIIEHFMEASHYTDKQT